MGRGRHIAVGLVTAGIGSWLVSCSSSSSGTTVSSSTTLPPVQFGVALSLTGSLKNIGQPGANAVKVAETQLNAIGGILGRPVEFVIEDDQTDNTVAQNVLNDIFNRGMAGMLGPTSSGQAQTEQPLIHSLPMPTISATASGPQMSTGEPPTDRFFFRTAASHALQARAIAIFATTLVPAPFVACKNMVVVYQNDGYGAPIEQLVATEMAGHGGQVTTSISVPSTPKSSYSTEVGQIMALSPRPDCQLLVIFDPSGDQYMRDFLAATQADSTWKNFLTIGSNALAVSSFLTNGRANPADPNSPTVAEGTFETIIDTNPTERPQYNDFKNIYTLQFPLPAGTTDLPIYASNIYDAAVLLALAVQAAGTATDPVAIRNQFFNITNPANQAFGPAEIPDMIAAVKKGQAVTYKGASGDCNFSPTGDVVSDFVVLRVQNGQFGTFATIKDTQLE